MRCSKASLRTKDMNDSPIEGSLRVRASCLDTNKDMRSVAKERKAPVEVSFKRESLNSGSGINPYLYKQ